MFLIKKRTEKNKLWVYVKNGQRIKAATSFVLV